MYKKIILISKIIKFYFLNFIKFLLRFLNKVFKHFFSLDPLVSKPYSNENVEIIIDDARSHINKTKKIFDVIVYGLLDSQMNLSSKGGIRLDSYVYTVEAFKEARSKLNKNGFLVYIVCSFHPFETIDVIDKIMQKHKNIKIHDVKSNKMIKRQNGYFINPLSFKDLGGSDIFFVSVLEKTE